MKDTHKHITANIEQSGPYNYRLTDELSNAFPAGKLDATLPIDPRPNVIISQKDGVNYVTGCDTQTPSVVLDVIDSTVGHEAANHAVYTETFEAARSMYAGLVDSQCLIKTVVDIYYKEDSGFTRFKPVDRSDTHRSKNIVELLIERYTTDCDDSEGDDDGPDSETSIDTDRLQAHIKCWVTNTTDKPTPTGPSLDEKLSRISGLEKVSYNVQDGIQRCYRLNGRVWDFE